MQFENERSLSDSPEVKVEYLSCLKRLSSLINHTTTEGTRKFKGATLQELEDEIKNLEVEISSYRNRKN